MNKEPESEPIDLHQEEAARTVADVTALTTFLVLLPKIAPDGSGDQEITRRQRAEAVAALAALPKELGPAAVPSALQQITSQDRALLAEALLAFAERVREPGRETGQRVDDMIRRLQRELGPLIVQDRETDKAAEQERLRAEVRDSIRLRLRETGAIGPRDET